MMNTANGTAPGWLFKINTLRVGDVVPIGWHVEHVRALDPLQAA